MKIDRYSKPRKAWDIIADWTVFTAVAVGSWYGVFRLLRWLIR